MKNINLNQIDIKYALSNAFDHRNYQVTKNGKTDYRYGTKMICITNYILGLCKTNKRRGPHSFYHNATKTNINLDVNQSIIYYEHIAKRFNCSVEWVRRIVKQLCFLKIINHVRDKSTGLWHFVLLQAESVLGWLKARKQIFYYTVKTKTLGGSVDSPDNNELSDTIVDWGDS